MKTEKITKFHNNKSNFRSVVLSLNNEAPSINELKNQYLSMQVKLRKSNLFSKILAKRLEHFTAKCIEPTLSLEQIVFLLHHSNHSQIGLGVVSLKQYLNEVKLTNQDFKYIIDKIYYRLLDLFINENQYLLDISVIFINLTLESNTMIKILLKDNIIEHIKGIIQENYKKFENNDKELKENMIILISNLMSYSKDDYYEVTKNIDVSLIIRNNIVSSPLPKNIEQREYYSNLLYNYFNYLPKSLINKSIDIVKYIINQIQIYQFSSTDLENLLQILSMCCKTKKVASLIISYPGLLKIFDQIIIEKNQLMVEVYKLLYQIIKLIKNLTNNLWGKLKCNEPITLFYNELIYFYSNIGNNAKFINQSITYLLKIINHLLLDNEANVQQLTGNNNYLTVFNDFFQQKNSKKIKNEIINIFITLLKSNNIQEIILNIVRNNIHIHLISFLIQKNSSYEMNSKIKYNLLCFLQLILENDNIIKPQIDNFDIETILDSLIISNDSDVSMKAKEIYIKYYSKNEENYYIPSSNNQMIIDK